MKDLNEMAALLETYSVKDKEITLKLYFYDPNKFHPGNLSTIAPYDGDKFVLSANNFLEYTDGSPEENAKLDERFPVLMSFLRGETIEVQDCVWRIIEDSLVDSLFNKAPFSFKYLTSEYKLHVLAGHDAWSIGDKSNAYKLEIEFDCAKKCYLTDEDRHCFIIEGLRFKLKYPEIPKRGERIYASPVRFDEFSSFKDLKWLILAMSMWPKNVLLFSAVTRYLNEKPLVSSVVYRPEYHTMREVFVRLFSKTKKSFSNSLFDICKVIDIMDRRDSNSQGSEKYTNYGKIGGLDRATIKAFLGLRMCCRTKDIKGFKEVVQNEINITYEFCKKLERLKSECEKIFAEDPEAELKDLSKKLIGELYDNVVLDPVAYASMYVEKDKWESRDLMITQVLSNMCITTEVEEELLEDNPKGDNNNVNGTTTGTGSGSTGGSPEEVLRIQDNSGEAAS